MDFFTHPYFLVLLVFVLGYLAIIFEYPLRVNKTAISLLIAVLCWTLYFFRSLFPIKEDLLILNRHVSEISQIIFFLMGAMTLVELIDSHQGFKIITDLIHAKTKVKMLAIVTLFAFLLSAVLDNLTTTILMVSIVRKLIPHQKERFLFSCMIVIAANAGGAWTPIGDVTTTMLWIGGEITTLRVMRSLFLPSLVSILIPLGIFSFQLKKSANFEEKTTPSSAKLEHGARTVLILGLLALLCVPLFKALTGLPPFMGILISLAVLWLLTDFLHYGVEKRKHLRIPHVLTKIDTASILFFLGILLSVAALESAGILHDLAGLLNTHVKNLPLIATLLGILSAVIDNVPLVAASMGMYHFPSDDSFWHMIAYAAGTGGSIFIIGSSSGVALMGMEKIDFVSYMKKATLPVLAGYLIGIAAYLIFTKVFV